jgi:uncharacterized protein
VGKMEYKKIYKEFIKNNKYKKLSKENHHGTSRIAHINRVAKVSYDISKFFKLDYISTTRGALMHDFFLNDELDNLNSKRFKTHPEKAYENASKYFKINDMEKDIILSHMFPITHEMPKYKESHVVNVADKLVSVYEFGRYQIKYASAVAVIFAIELMNNVFKII